MHATNGETWCHPEISYEWCLNPYLLLNWTFHLSHHNLSIVSPYFMEFLTISQMTGKWAGKWMWQCQTQIHCRSIITSPAENRSLKGKLLDRQTVINFSLNHEWYVIDLRILTSRLWFERCDATRKITSYSESEYLNLQKVCP